MKDLEINTNLNVNFQIDFVSNFFSTNPLINDKCFGTDRRFIVIDELIAPLYLKKLKNLLLANNLKPFFYIISCQETDKNLDTLIGILQEVENYGLMRKSEPIVAIGGGVLCDIVGFAASIYRRGVPYIKIPTTLIGIIDVSVGVKTGINFKQRRNRLGSYHPPTKSILDKYFLQSLDRIHIVSGLGEIFKISLIKSFKLFDLLEHHGKALLDSKFQISGISDEVLYHSVEEMRVELETNLWEKNLKRCVDFGHSFSPLIEMRSLEKNNFQPLTHGQAVAIDCLFSSVISHLRGYLNIDDIKRLVKVMKSLELPTEHELFYDYTFVIEALNDTMKHRDGNQYLPIPVKIGEYTFINDLSIYEIKKTIEVLKNLNS